MEQQQFTAQRNIQLPVADAPKSPEKKFAHLPYLVEVSPEATQHHVSSELIIASSESSE